MSIIHIELTRSAFREVLTTQHLDWDLNAGAVGYLYDPHSIPTFDADSVLEHTHSMWALGLAQLPRGIDGE